MAKTSCMIAVLVAILGAGAARADEAYEKEVRAAKEKLAVLLRKADELAAAGREEDAREVRQKAEALRMELQAFVKRHEGGKDDVLEGLEHGIEALRRLGREEDARHLEEIARDVRGGDREREVLERWIEVMRVGVEELAQAGKREAAEQLERGVHAFRVSAAGRTDPEAKAIRERAPGRGDLAELLAFAAKIAAERGWEGRAEMLAKLSQEFAGQAKRRERGGVEPGRLVRAAMEALAAAGRGDAAERLEHGLHAMELEHAGRRDEEAMRVRKSAPDRREMGKLMMAAADHLAAAGKRDLADMVDRLGKEWVGADAPRREGDDWRRAMERIERLEGRMKGLEEGLERIAGALRELNEDLKRARG